jgi:hypothetical protein
MQIQKKTKRRNRGDREMKTIKSYMKIYAKFDSTKMYTKFTDKQSKAIRKLVRIAIKESWEKGYKAGKKDGEIAKSYHHGFLLGEKLGYQRGLKDGKKYILDKVDIEKWDYGGLVFYNNEMPRFTEVVKLSDLNKWWRSLREKETKISERK